MMLDEDAWCYQTCTVAALLASFEMGNRVNSLIMLHKAGPDRCPVLGHEAGLRLSFW